MATYDMRAYIRVRQQTDAEWHTRLAALSEAERAQLEARMEIHPMAATVLQWPDLMEISMRPFADED